MIAYIIQCYANLNHIPRLIGWIWDPGNVYLISINPRSSDDFDLEAAVSHLPNVHIVRSVPVTWGGESLMVAMLDGIDELLNRSSSWQYVINISESCFPLKPQSELFAHLNRQRAQGITEHISHWTPLSLTDWSAAVRSSDYEAALELRPDTQFRSDVTLNEYFSDVMRSPVIDAAARASLHVSEGEPGVVYCRPLYRTERLARAAFFGRHPFRIGRIWFCLSRQSAEWIARSVVASLGFETMKSIFNPDECFLQTMMLGPDGPVPPNQIAPADAIWYQSGGPHSVNDEMLPELKASGAFFARKLHPATSPMLVAHIEGMADPANVEIGKD